MPTAQDIVDYVFEIAPNPAGRVENVYQHGDGSDAVSGVGVAWWLTADILEDMGRAKQNLGLTHETVFFPTPRGFSWGPAPDSEDAIPANRRVRDVLKRHGITVHRFHSNIDSAEWGIPRMLLKKLGWDRYPTEWLQDVPVVELPPRSLAALVEEVRTKLELPFVRWDGDPDRSVSRVGLPFGGMCQGWGGAMCPAGAGIDALIGGDVIDGIVGLARTEGWAVIDAMHHATEMPGLEALAARIGLRFPAIPVRFYPNASPWRAS